MTSQPPNGENENEGQDPFQAMFQQFLGQSGMSEEDLRKMGIPTDPAGMQAMFAQVQSMFAAGPSDGPVNWKAAKDHARRVVASAGDPSVSDKQRKVIGDAVQLAQLWVDDHTAFGAPGTDPAAWSRSEWIEATFETWQEITAPVAESMTTALTESIQGQLPEEMKGMLGGASGMLANAGSMMFAMQLGQVIGGLAGEVVSSTDIGFPLAKDRSAMLARNVEDFGEGLGVPEQEVVIYLAVREVALTRLFHATPWLRQHVIDLITTFSQEIHIDMDRIEGLAAQIDPSDPTAMQEALGSGVFMPEQTAKQEATLKRLETILALIEGWVDVITVRATTNLPGASALAETMRRRRASGGPAEHAFGSFVGLELRPRRMREAAEFWRFVEQRRGLEDRDGLWESAELLPTEQDLDDPAGYESRRGLLTASDEEFDAALEKLLGAGPDESAPESDSGSGSGHDAEGPEDPDADQPGPEGEQPGGSGPRDS
ncbi:zinc-dependent metalloprotease [Kocuria coralli]|uniref:Zinc-dependent metalloprotease n=1 Tax=Kocuria coralli TaxID=1461025 RepID=A0A5J5L1Y1_9MICC|nr:zinc-dependent metalloprotease [Kocuria coralli]KAA9395568.1 zinc-dependent metalloprotease [Kocuria coralli]